MRTPIHARGYTFFPKGKWIDGAWLPVIEIVEGRDTITPHLCAGSHPNEDAALAAARREAIALAVTLCAKW